MHFLTGWILCFVLATSACNGQVNTIQVLNGASISVDDMDRFIDEQMTALNMPGLSIAVINDAEVVYHRTLGVRHNDTKEPIDDQTIFEAASMTKPVLAYLVMKAVDEGVMDLDTPLYQYLPNYDLDHDDRYKTITARTVLTHSTGLPNWRYVNKGQYLTLAFDPGTQFSYSGEGFEYLGNALAHLKGGTKKDLEWMIRESIFDPMGVEQAYFIWNETLEEHKANGHNGTVPNMRSRPELPSMAGGLQTEAKSFARFVIGLMNGTGLTQESHDELLSMQFRLPEDHVFATSFGQKAWTLGLSLDSTAYGNIYGHGGNNGDFQSHFEFSRDKRLGYVFLTNSDVGERFNTKLKPFLRNGKLELSALEKEYDVVDRKIAEYVDGSYEGFELNAFPSDGFAWVKDRTFSEGVIEFDMKGSGEAGASFIGIALRGVNERTYEGIYFRPFHFDDEEPASRGYMVQYHNLPTHNFRMLRNDSPGVYEGEIISPPDPDDWFQTRIVVEDGMIAVYVNDQAEPALEVESLSERSSGKIGLWVGFNSSGRFANLKITDR